MPLLQLSDVGEIYTFTIIGIIIGFLINLISLMLAKGFGDERSILMAKANLIDALGTGMLVVAITTIFLISDESLKFLSNSLGVQDYSQIIDYVYSSFDVLSSSVYSAIAKAKISLDGWLSLSSFSISIFTIPVSTLLFNSIVFEHATRYAYIIYDAVPIEIGLSTVKLLLKFIIEATPYILGVGVLLRSFDPSRALGAAMIALALGSYFVFPSTLYILQNRTVPLMAWTESKGVDYCGLKTLGVLSLPNDVFSSLKSPLSESLSSSDVEEFIKVMHLSLLIDYAVATGITFMFIFYTSLILSKGVIAYSFVGKLGSLL